MCASEPPAVPPRFSSLDVRVGKIVDVWAHPESDKLFCEKIDVGEAEPREIASGLRAHYTLEQLKDRSVLVVCNLKPAKLAGFESSGMVFCASSADKGTVEFIDPPAGAVPGDRVLTLAEADALSAGGSAIDVEPATSNQMKKKKLLEAMSEGLVTSADREATYLGVPLVVAGGRCTAPTIAGGRIS
jgi:methionine--tRNA ligase beta chain